jgi:hypothetical protein
MRTARVRKSGENYQGISREMQVEIFYPIYAVLMRVCGHMTDESISPDNSTRIYAIDSSIRQVYGGKLSKPAESRRQRPGVA